MYVDAPFFIVDLHLMKVSSGQIYELTLQYASFTLKVNSRFLHYNLKPSYLIRKEADFKIINES